MIVKEILSEIESCSANNEIGSEPGKGEKGLINAVDKYLKQNYCELYSINNLEVIFKKAKEDKEMEQKMVNAISSFILN